MLDQFQRFGHDLFTRGLMSSHGGNMSVRMGDRIIITRTGAMLAHLTERDLIETGLEEDDSNIMLASSEIVVHRAIYQNTSALAIVHVHPPFAVAQSMCVEDAIIPIDSEGSYLFRKVPVVHTETTVGSKDVAKIAAKICNRIEIKIITVTAIRPSPFRSPSRFFLLFHLSAGKALYSATL